MQSPSTHDVDAYLLGGPPSTPGLIAPGLIGHPPSSSSPAGPVSPGAQNFFGPRLVGRRSDVTKAALRMHVISTAPAPHYALPGANSTHGSEAVSPGPMSAHTGPPTSSNASTVSETETSQSHLDMVAKSPGASAASRHDSLQPATDPSVPAPNDSSFGLGLSGMPQGGGEQEMANGEVNGEDEEEGTPPPLPMTEAVLNQLRGSSSRGHRRELSRMSAAEQEVASILVTVGTPRVSTPRMSDMPMSTGPMRDLSAAFEAHDRSNAAPGGPLSSAPRGNTGRRSVSPCPSVESSSPSHGHDIHVEEPSEGMLITAAHQRMHQQQYPQHHYSAPDYLEHPHEMTSSSPMQHQQHLGYGPGTSPFGNALGPPVASTSRAPPAKAKRKRAEEDEDESVADDGALPDPYAKPPFSYAGLIGQAIMTRPDRRMALADIYSWISTCYPYYKLGDAGWQNSIRHNLSLNECFYKTARLAHEIGKGSLWAIKAGSEGQFAGGGFVKKSQLGKKVKAQKVNAAAKALLVAQEQYRKAQSSPGSAGVAPVLPLPAAPPPSGFAPPVVATLSATRTTRKRAPKGKPETSPLPGPSLPRTRASAAGSTHAPPLSQPVFSSSSPMRPDPDDDDDDEYDPDGSSSTVGGGRKRSTGPASDEINAASTMLAMGPSSVKRARTNDGPAPGTYMSGTSMAASAAAYAAATAHSRGFGQGVSTSVAPMLVSSPAHASAFARPSLPGLATLGAPFMPPPAVPNPFGRRDSLPPITAAAPPAYESHLLRSPVSSAREEPGPVASPTRMRTFSGRARTHSAGDELGDDLNRTPTLRSTGRSNSANGSSGVFGASRSLQGASGGAPGTPAHLDTPRYEHSSPQRGTNPYDPNDQAMFEVQRRLAPTTPKMTTPQFGNSQFGSPW